MLHKTIKMAIPYAQELADKGVQLAIPLNSDLGILMQHSVADSPSVRTSVQNFVQGVEDAVIVTGKVSDYEGYREALVQELRGPVLGHIRMSQEVSIIASTLSENVRNYAKNAQDSSVTEKFSVVKDRLAEVFQHDQISNSLSSKLVADRTFSGVSLVTGVRTRDQILGLVSSTGNTKLDAAVQQMVEQFDDYQWLENIYYAFINTNTGFETCFNPNYMDSVTPGERASVYLVAGLIASNMVEKTPDDANGSLKMFREAAASCRDYCFNRAASAVEDYNALVSRNVLFSSMKNIDGCVCVYVINDVYAEWLNSGGRPELVMAAAMSNQQIRTVEEFANNAASLTGIWNNFCAMHRSQESIRAAQILRSLYIQSFVESISNVELFEKEYRETNIQHAENAIAGAQKWLEQISVDALNNFDMVALELVGRFRFSYLPAYEILKEINVIRCDCDDISVREAALVASTKYIARYLVTQMSISRTK